MQDTITNSCNSSYWLIICSSFESQSTQLCTELCWNEIISSFITFMLALKHSLLILFTRIKYYLYYSILSISDIHKLQSFVMTATKYCQFLIPAIYTTIFLIPSFFSSCAQFFWGRSGGKSYTTDMLRNIFSLQTGHGTNIVGHQLLSESSVKKHYLWMFQLNSAWKATSLKTEVCWFIYSVRNKNILEPTFNKV